MARQADSYRPGTLAVGWRGGGRTVVVGGGAQRVVVLAKGETKRGRRDGKGG